MTPMPHRKQLIDKEDHTISLTRQFELLSIPRSSYYYTPCREKKENLEIMRLLDEQYFHTPFYGVNRLHAWLLSQGYALNKKRLRQLMSLTGWKTLYPEKRTTISDAKSYKYPYLLKDMKIERRNQVWAVDITYIPMEKGFMYLFALIDLHSRYVVGWSLSYTMSKEWCVQTLEGAIRQHGKPEIINSDQGSQFTSELWTGFLGERQINISMDGKGRVLDNVFVERLWRSVKYEYVYLHVCDNGNELWDGLNHYFNFYNNERLHQSLAFLTPSKLYYYAA